MPIPESSGSVSTSARRSRRGEEEGPPGDARRGRRLRSSLRSRFHRLRHRESRFRALSRLESDIRDAGGAGILGASEHLRAIRRFYFADLIAEAENRDMSQLNLIDDDEYRAGLARMRDDAKRAEYLIGDIAFLDYLARVPAA